MVVVDKVFKLDKINKQLSEIIDNTQKPMSIIDIQNKYKLQFPFKVRRVLDTQYFSGITEIKGIKPTRFTDGSVNMGTNNRCWVGGEMYMQCASLPYYTLHEES